MSDEQGLSRGAKLRASAARARASFLANGGLRVYECDEIVQPRGARVPEEVVVARTLLAAGPVVGDQTAIAARLLEHARMENGQVRNHVLYRAPKAKADSQLRRDLRGINVDPEAPEHKQMIPLPWPALQDAVQAVFGMNKPVERLRQFAFVAEAHRVTGVELDDRLDAMRAGDLGMTGPLVRGPAPQHLALFFATAAKALDPQTLKAIAGQLHRPDEDRPQQRILGTARQLRAVFMDTHDGKYSRGVDRAYQQLCRRVEACSSLGVR